MASANRKETFRLFSVGRLSKAGCDSPAGNRLKEGRERGRGPSPDTLTLGEPLRLLRRPAPALRTETPLRDIPVFRSAYFPKKLFSFFSKTLDLQVRCANPTGNFAPKRPFETFRCFGRLIFRKSSSAFSPKRSTSRFAARTLRVSSHRNAPSGHSGVTVGLFPQRVHSTLCSKTLDLQVRCAHPAGTGSRRATPQALRGMKGFFRNRIDDCM